MGFRKKRSLKVMVVITLWSFLLSIGGGLWLESARADSDSVRIPAVSSANTVSPPFFEIPNYLGQITQQWIGDSDNFIIHIQDAHCNYDCQHAIAKLIDHFRIFKGVNIVNLEGGSGEYDLSAFMEIPNARTRQKTADEYVKNGTINGAEYYAITNPRKVKLWGVEDPQLYGKNLQAYKLTRSNKNEISEDIDYLLSVTDDLKKQYYTEEILFLDRKLKAYKNEEIQTEEILNYIYAEAKEHEIDGASYENMELLKKAFSIEKDIDFVKAEKERGALIEYMSELLSKNDLRELLKKAYAFKAGAISTGDFYAYLFEKVEFLNIDMTLYSQLQKYKEYVSNYTAIDKEMVYQEITKLAEKIKASLFENEKQSLINDLSFKMELLERLSENIITKQEYKLYKQRGWAPLFKYLMLLQDDVSIEAIQKAQELQKSIPVMESFYEYSYKRDDVFVGNLRFSKNRKIKKQAAFLITGGFHTENLFNKLKAKGISYVSIQPCFQIEKGAKNNYFDLLAGVSNPISHLVSVSASSLAIHSYLTQITGGVYTQEEIDLWKMSIKIVADLVEGKSPEVIIGEKGNMLVFSFDQTKELVEGCFINDKQVFVEKRNIRESVLQGKQKEEKAHIGKEKGQYVLKITEPNKDERVEPLYHMGEINHAYLIREIKRWLDPENREAKKTFLDKIGNLIGAYDIEAYSFLKPCAGSVAFISSKYNMVAFLLGLESEDMLVCEQILSFLAAKGLIWFKQHDNEIIIYQARKVGTLILPKVFSKRIAGFALTQAQKEGFLKGTAEDGKTTNEQYIKVIQDILFGKGYSFLQERLQIYFDVEAEKIESIKENEPKKFMLIEHLARSIKSKRFLLSDLSQEYFYPIAYGKLLEQASDEELSTFLEALSMDEVEQGYFFFQEMFLNDKISVAIPVLRKTGKDPLYKLFYILQVFNEMRYNDWENIPQILFAADKRIENYWEDLLAFLILHKERSFFMEKNILTAFQRHLQSDQKGKLAPLGELFVRIIKANRKSLPLSAYMIEQMLHKNSIEEVLKKTKYLPDLLAGRNYLENSSYLQYFCDLPEEAQIQIINNYQQIVETIKEGNFEVTDPVHVFLGYQMLCDQLEDYKDKKIVIGFNRYLKGLQTKTSESFSTKEIAEMKYLSYEAIKVRNFLMQLKEKADTLGVPLVVVENMSYGWIAALPIEQEIEEMGIKIIRTKAGSTAAHDNPTVMHGFDRADDAELFSEKDTRYIIENNPMVAVIDGSYSLDPETVSTRSRQFIRYADAHQAYRNWFHAVSQDPNDAAFAMKNLRVAKENGKQGKLVSKALEKYEYYKQVRDEAEEIRTNRENYAMFFWYPGKKKMSACSERERRDIPENCDLSNIDDPSLPFFDKITGPSLVWVNANIEDEMIPDTLRAPPGELKGKRNKPEYHNSAYWDDVENRDRAYFVITDFGPQLRIDDFQSNIKEFYQEVKDIFQEENIVPEKAEDNDQDFDLMGDGEYDPLSDLKENIRSLDAALLNKRIEGLDLWQKQIENGTFEDYAVIPDVHGDVDALNRILDDLSSKGVKKFVFLGDYFDRGPNSFEVFEKVKQLKEKGQAICLMGNHDLIFIRTILYKNTEAFSDWITNGGFTTLSEIMPDVIEKHRSDDGIDVDAVFQEIVNNETLINIATWFVENLDIYHINQTGAMFVHAGLPLDSFLFPGTIKVTYREKFSREALEAMQQDLRKGGEHTRQVLERLDTLDSVVWVVSEWISVLKSSQEPSILADVILDQMGVNMIFFGHNIQKYNKPFNMDNRIFGIDLCMSKSMNNEQSTGGFARFSGAGFAIDTFNADGSMREGTILDKAQLLVQIANERELIKNKLNKLSNVDTGYPIGFSPLEHINVSKLSGDQIAIAGQKEKATKENNFNNIFSHTKEFVSQVADKVYPVAPRSKGSQDKANRVVAVGVQDIEQIHDVIKGVSDMEQKKLMQLIRQGLYKKVSEFNIGDIRFVFFEDTPIGRNQMMESLEDMSVDDTKVSTVVFSTELPERVKQKVLYHVKIDTEKAVVPLTDCAMTGIAILNYFDISSNIHSQEKDINNALNLVASGMASIIGSYDDETIAELAREIVDENGKLRPSGSILLRVRPIDPQYIKEAYERELMVLRSA